MKKLSLVVITLLLVSMVVYGQESGWRESGSVVKLRESGDKVGIGTTSPLSKLSVGGNGASNAAIYGGGTSYGILGSGSSAGIKGSGGTAGVLAFGNTYDFYASNSSGKSYFAGKVGIGTTNPADKLHVNGVVQMNGFKLPTGASDGYVLTSNGSGVGAWKVIAHRWSQSGSNVYRSSGNVGIGTSSPSQRLHVNGNIYLPYNNKVIFGGASIEGYNDGYGGLKLYGNGGGNNNLAITVHPTGKVGIGTDQIQSELTVNGTITAEEIEVQLEILPDFVFEDNYKLMPLNKLEKHIKKEKSLPGIPTSEEAATNGLKVGEMQAKLLQKVEELTLYVIELNQKVEDLSKENEALRQKISPLSN
jgi:hypothetical protein